MTEEKTVTNQEVQVPQAPATPTDSTVETKPIAEVQPAEATVEDGAKKQTSAFIKMRMDNRELKRKLAEANATPTPTPATPIEETEQDKPVILPKTEAPAAVKTELDPEVEKQALQELSEDADTAKVPGAVMDILAMIDSDKRLSRLYYEIDPKLAIREAKNVYLSKAGVAKPPPVPKATTVSGGIPSGNVDLQGLISEIDRCRPGTRAYTELARKIDAEMKRQTGTR